ncbi:hypothetical protein OEZ85_010002 [Tetradesmus obliquus]|uniref:Uncharacterized protein n=1 Tax=Tetradesmus obliquus TaxID=3088 RepID=A0ABY8UBT7_TETOB|nr:hypothetical protein OEZ85_010002 [Tetradesmus obliquus]
MAVAIGTSPETIAAVFCSRAEVHDVLQAASWLQQLGYRGHSQPLEGAVVGLVQESSRKLGLQRMRLLLVRHSSPTTDDDGLLQDSSTQLTCCGSAAASQEVVVTLEALVKQLPPGTSDTADSSTACGLNNSGSSISAACWGAAVAAMQHGTAVLGSKQQVGRAMLRLALYYHSYQLLQPAVKMLPAELLPYRRLYSKYTAFLQATGLLQHFVVSSMGANLVLRQQQPAYPLRQ